MGLISGLLGYFKSEAPAGQVGQFAAASQASTPAAGEATKRVSAFPGNDLPQLAGDANSPSQGDVRKSFKAPAATPERPSLLQRWFGSTAVEERGTYTVTWNPNANDVASASSPADDAAASPRLSNPRMERAVAVAKAGATGASTSAGVINSLLSKVKKAPGLSFFSAKTVEYHQNLAEEPAQPEASEKPKRAPVNIFQVDAHRKDLLKPMQGRRELARGQTLEQLQEAALVALGRAMRGAEPEANTSTRAVADQNIGDYVKACLGLEGRPLFVNETFDKLAYQLSKNASSVGIAKQPVTRSSVQLLAALYVHREGANAFKRGAGPQPDIGNKFYEFVAHHAGLTEGEVRAAIKPEYFHEIKIINAEDGQPQVQIFGKYRPLSEFHVDTDQKLQQSRAMGRSRLQTFMEVVHFPVREGRAESEPAPVAVPTERKGKPAATELEAEARSAASASTKAPSAVMVGQPRPIRVLDGPVGERVRGQAGNAKKLLHAFTSSETADTYPSAEALRRALSEGTERQRQNIRQCLNIGALVLLDELEFELAGRANPGRPDGQGKGIEAVLKPFLDQNEGLDWLGIAFQGASSLGKRNMRVMLRVAGKVCDAIAANAAHLSAVECGDLVEVIAGLDPMNPRDSRVAESNVFSESRAKAQNALFARAKAEQGGEAKAKERSKEKGKEKLTDAELEAEQHFDDLAPASVGDLEPTSAPSPAMAGNLAASRAWAQEEIRVARDVSQISNPRGLDTYPSAELRRIMYQLSEPELKLALASLTPDQLSALVADDPAQRVLSWEGAEYKDKRRLIEESLHRCALDLLSELDSELGFMAQPGRRASQGIDTVLASFRRGDPRLGWLTAAAARAPLLGRPALPQLLAAARNVIGALRENAAELSLDEAWTMVQMLGALEPLDRAVPGAEGEFFARDRANTMSALHAHCLSVAKETADDGVTVVGDAGVYTPKTHKKLFDQINKDLPDTLKGSEPGVLVGLELPDGRKFEKVAIPYNFFHEAPDLLASTPDAVMIDGSNMGALVGLRDRGLADWKLEGEVGRAPGTDTRTTDLLFNTLAAFCRSGDELRNLAGLLTQTSANKANKAYTEAVAELILDPSESPDTAKETAELALSAVTFEGKRIRIHRNDEANIEVRLIGNVSFKDPNLHGSAANKKVFGPPPPFDAELSRGLCVPVFLIYNEGKKVELRRVEHYSIFTKHAPPASRLNPA